ncbi:1-acyl-sn-glycerol-3-phosphate acyltransferase [Calothrix sp. 336/3]|uniref:1-acyl-sn-glycerol-3-phosphate acyltransferase n=1 Tax=Calothrix sp. 336/3 TaxID=1337936 RepID=UPI0004E2F22E|nr:1-acyl-sn-glycerol-3-phosphate acyltransferase [Calothrix sp. 336/3]AKG20901.1 glycerol acyltransferase [Calothrix sp. 336/3]
MEKHAEQPSHSQKKPGWSLDARDVEFIKSLMPIWGFLYDYYFRVKTSGWENVPTNEKVLFVGSHNGGLASPDMQMMMYDWFRRFGVERPVYGLMHPKVAEVSPEVAELAAKVGAITAHPKMAIAAFRSGASVLVYPGGIQDVFRLHSLRDKIYFHNRHAFIKLALREQVPIVPAISWGAHDTLIVLADLHKIIQKIHSLGIPWLFNVDPEVFPVYLGLPWGIGIGPLPNIPFPVQIYTRICPPIIFERYGREAAGDAAYVDACYQIVVSKMQQELDELIEGSRE